ncbi:MAG: hypothetical protein AAF626_16390 [Pseudomonadota bacterium]
MIIFDPVDDKVGAIGVKAHRRIDPVALPSDLGMVTQGIELVAKAMQLGIGLFRRPRFCGVVPDAT